MVTRGSFKWEIRDFAGGQDSYHSKSEIPANCHAIVRNFWTDGETLTLRGGHTGIPTSGAVGASTTAGARGLYVWRPHDGSRHILAAYPRAASPNRISVYAIHTSGATALGGEFATAPRVSFAGFGDRVYMSDGRTRLKYSDGVNTAEAEHIDSPAVVRNIAYGRVPGGGGIRTGDGEHDFFAAKNVRWFRVVGIRGTAPHASKYPEYVALGTVWPFPLLRAGPNGPSTWTARGTGLSMSIATALGGPAGGKQDEWNLRLVGTTSLVNGAKAYYSYGTGGTTTVGGVHFWGKSTRLGEYLRLELIGGGTVRARDLPIQFNQVGRWEFQQFFLDHLPRLERQNIGSARIVVADPNQTFTAEFSNIYIDGLQQGDYQVAGAFFDSTHNILSPLSEVYDLRAERGPYRFSAFSFPGLRSKDRRVNRVRWYRRGGNSVEWRMVAEVPTATQAWDFAADIDAGDIYPNVPGPAPHADLIAPVGYSRMVGLGGYGYGDFIPGIPTGATMLATSSRTAMSRVTMAGISRGVEIYCYTTGASTPTGRFQVLLKDATVVKRRTLANASNLAMGRWNPILWTSGYRIEQGSGVYNLTFSGVANCNFRVGSYTSGRKPSYYHLIEQPRRVRISREGVPYYFDPYTRMDAADTDGYWFDLPGQGGPKISGWGPHGNSHLAFTEHETFEVAGDSAADASCIPVHSSIGCASHETIAECDDWTIWVGGQAGRLRVHAFGPKVETPVWIPVHEGGGFNRVGLAIEPLLALVTTPSKMSATCAKGWYHLFFGQAVTYGGDTYTGASLNLASWGWVTHSHSSTNVKVPRFAATDPQTGQVILASPANSTAGNNTNRLWWFDTANNTDGVQAIPYIFETRHRGTDGATKSKLRGYQVQVDQATAGPMTINAYANLGTAGTMVHSLTAAGRAVRNLTQRFGARAQGLYVGMRLSGTSSTDITIRSVTAFLDAKR